MGSFPCPVLVRRRRPSNSRSRFLNHDLGQRLTARAKRPQIATVHAPRLTQFAARNKNPELSALPRFRIISTPTTMLKEKGSAQSSSERAGLAGCCSCTSVRSWVHRFWKPQSAANHTAKSTATAILKPSYFCGAGPWRYPLATVPGVTPSVTAHEKRTSTSDRPPTARTRNKLLRDFTILSLCRCLEVYAPAGRG